MRPNRITFGLCRLGLILVVAGWLVLSGVPPRNTTGAQPLLNLDHALPADATTDWAKPTAAVVVEGPDGKIVYEVRRGPEVGYLSEIWIAESDGTGPHRLTEGNYDHDPQWSPTGNTIAFTREYPVDIAPDGVESLVLAMSAEGGTPLPLVLLELEEGTYSDLREQLFSWTPDGSGIIFRRTWLDNLLGQMGGIYSSGGLIPRANLFAISDALTSPHCVDLGPGGTVQRQAAVPHPDPGDPRVLIQSETICSDPIERFVEAGTGSYGYTTSGPTSLIPITYPPGGGSADQFSATDWSPDGTEIYDGGLWAAPASGGAARGLAPDVRFGGAAGVIPAEGCQIAVSKAVTWSDGDGSWAPAGDMIAASLGSTSYEELGSGPTGTWCTPQQDPDGGGSSIWKIDPSGGTAPTLLIPAPSNTQLIEPDAQCRVGSCLTVLRVVASGPLGSTYTFSGDVAGVTTPVDPFGQGGVLTKRVIPGQKSIAATVPPSQALIALTCNAPYTANLPGGSVSVTVESGSIVTCTFTFNGTSVDDRDGDGILNDDDACPDAHGPASTNGCPDRDGDGVPDGTDACPDAPGPIANNGCPRLDTDGDGVSDAVEEKTHSDPNDSSDLPVGASLLEEPLAALAPEVDCGPQGEDLIDTCHLEPGDVIAWKFRGWKGDTESVLGMTYFTHVVIVIGRIDLDGKRTADGNITLEVAVADITPDDAGTEMSLRKWGDDGNEGSSGALTAFGVARPTLSRVQRKAAATDALGILIAHGVDVESNRARTSPVTKLYAFEAQFAFDPTAFGPIYFYCSSFVGRAYGFTDQVVGHVGPFYSTGSYFTPDDLLRALGITDGNWLVGSQHVGLAFATFSPAHLLVTDPAGRRAGLGPDGVMYDEIPDALWRLTDDNESVAFPHADLTDWLFTLSGYDTGPYWFVATSINVAGGDDTFAVPGWTRPGLVETFRFDELEGLQERPVAVDDAADAVGGISVNVDVLANDETHATGANLDPATLSIVDPPQHGTARAEAGGIDYLAGPSFTGSDSLTYRVCDGAGHCTQGVVTFSVTQPNTPTASPSATPSPTPTDTPAPAATDTPVPTATDTTVLTNTPTPTASGTAAATNTPVAASTSTSTSTNTPENTSTLVPGSSQTPTKTSTPVPQATSTNTRQATSTNTPQATSTGTPQATTTPDDDEKPTRTRTRTATAVASTRTSVASTSTSTPLSAVAGSLNTPRSGGSGGVRALPNAGQGAADGDTFVYLIVALFAIVGVATLTMTYRNRR